MKCVLPIALGVALSATPAFAVDDCLVGVWEADTDDLATMLTNSGMPGTATINGGSVILQIDADEILNMRVNDIEMEVVADGIPPIAMKMYGYNLGDISTPEDSAFIIQIEEFSVVSEAVVLGETMVIPLDETTAPLGHASGIYTCSATEVLFEPTDSADDILRMPRRWVRAS